MNAQAQAETKHEGRDRRGRFAKGNRGGPGNPFARQVAQLRRDLIKEYSQNADRINNSLIESAAKGNVEATKLVLLYVYGKPTPAARPDHVDLDEWRLIRKSSDIVGATDLASIPDLQFTLDVVRAGQESQTEQSMQMLSAEIDKAKLARLRLIPTRTSPRGMAILAMRCTRQLRAKHYVVHGLESRATVIWARTGET